MDAKKERRREIAREAFSILNLLLTEGSPTALNMAGEDLAPLREEPGFRELRAMVETMTME